jgi:signal transduction histidine kinase/DNA-binding LacI/PurR family transcriptional regulator
MRVGLILRNLDEEFQITVYRGIRDQARKRGVNLVCIQGETIRPDTTRAAPPFVLAGQIPFDGLLVLSSVIVDTSDLAVAETLPDLLPPLPAVSVGLDIHRMVSLTFKAGRSLARVVEHLILDHRCRRFLFIGGPPAHRDTRGREAVFRRTLDEFSASWPDLGADVDYGGFSELGGMEAIARHLGGEPYDAVVAANDNMALGVLKVLRSHDDPRWHRCAVTGFDDIPQAALEDPALTSVHQPLDQLGAQAFDTLLALVGGLKGPRHRSITAHPVIRQSCGCRLATPSDFERQGQLSSLESRFEGLRRAAFETENGLRLSNYFGRDLSAVTDQVQLFGRLDRFLTDLQVKDFFLLSHGLSHDGPRLVFEWRDGFRSELPEGGVDLGVRELFTQRTADHPDPWDLCTFHLVSGQEDQGLAVYSVDRKSLPHLTAALPHVAHALKRFRLREEQEDRNRRLEAMVQARTIELTQANAWLGDQKQLLDVILTNLPVPVAVYEAAYGSIVYANPAFEAEIGSRALYRSIGLFLDLPADCEGVELTLRTQRPGAETVPVLAYCVPLEFDGKASVLVTLVDLTRQKALEAEVLQISEVERRRFGLDLHDDICQRLAGLVMYLRSFSVRPPADPREVLAETQTLVDETLQLTRQYAHASFPMDLEKGGLDSVLRSLCNTASRQSGVGCTYNSELCRLEPPFEGAQALNLYRIVQEALHNAQKHARARNIDVQILVDERAVTTRIRDDGVGLTPAREGTAGMGLRSMSYRAAQLGARFTVANRAGGGTEIAVEIPRITPSSSR